METKGTLWSHGSGFGLRDERKRNLKRGGNE